MRIIAGEHRGRAILGPADAGTTRPITDRVKESLFNRLTSLGLLQPDGDNAEWAVVDVFSGTGSLGLEALSRGAARCTFVDMDREAVRRLRANIDELGLGDRAQVVQGSALAGYWSAALRPGSVQVAFIDPPYALMEEDKTRRSVLDMVAQLRPILEPGGVAMVRTPREIELPELEPFDGPAAANYGGMRLHFYQAPLEAA
ncbi:MAG: 16S rRNA (guanine(966)-N(2))-methyltransferase RsmD [Phycisphaeraceae bacterium]